MRFLFVLLFFCLGIQGEAQCAESPQQAIEEVQRAVDSRDMNLFEERVDTKLLLQQGAEAFQSQLLKSTSTSLPPALALMALSANTPQAQDLLRDVLVKEARHFLRYGIESGHFAGKPVPGVKPKGLVAPLMNDASLGQKTLKVTGKPVSDGDGVRLPCSLKDAGNDRTYSLDLQLRQAGGKWKVVRVNNLNQLVKKVGKEMGNQ